MAAFLLQQGEYLLRILIGAICGAAIGYERKSRMKEAGGRTHLIVALGSTMMMLVSKYGFFDVVTRQGISLDASRIAANIITGVSFLGAGVIFVRNRSISGLTTAAGIWATSGVGLAIGAGMYIVGVFATLMIIVLQVLLHKRLLFLEGPQSEQISITMERGLEPFQMLRDNLESINVQILEVKTQKNKDDTVSLELAVRVDQSLTVTEILACFQENPYIRALDI